MNRKRGKRERGNRADLKVTVSLKAPPQGLTLVGFRYTTLLQIMRPRETEKKRKGRLSQLWTF